MQLPIIVSMEKEGGKIWPIYHRHSVCAKNNKLGQEVFKISGCEGECLRYIRSIEWKESDEYFPVDKKELWVLGDVLLMN